MNPGIKHVSILVPIGDCSMANIEGTHQILLRVNDHLAVAGLPPLFRVQLVGLRSETSIRNGLFSVRPDGLIEDILHTDLIIIPAVNGDMNKVIVDNKGGSGVVPYLPLPELKQGTPVRPGAPVADATARGGRP